MSDEIQIEGKSFISSKRASELTGYAQDYIGQLSRKSLIDARRIGGLWYVSMESLDAYKKKAEEYKPQPPARKDTPSEPSTLVFFDGKEYVSAARGAEITGYAQDYVGQLARNGNILSKQIGNRWYVEKVSILSHKREKDSLLAAVQRDSVGLFKQNEEKNRPVYAPNPASVGSGPFLNYTSENGDLMALTGKLAESEIKPDAKVIEPELSSFSHVIPIKRPARRRYMPEVIRKQDLRANIVVSARKESPTPLLLAGAVTIIMVISIGYASILRQNSAYATNIRANEETTALAASAEAAFSQIGNILEPLLTRELVYTRTDSQ